MGSSISRHQELKSLNLDGCSTILRKRAGRKAGITRN